MNSESSSRHIRRSVGSCGGDTSSVFSSGGRTQKSSGSSKLSHGVTARDSGGSSGHCTHRSEPPSKLQVRTICIYIPYRRHNPIANGVFDEKLSYTGKNYRNEPNEIESAVANSIFLIYATSIIGILTSNCMQCIFCHQYIITYHSTLVNINSISQ